MGKPDENDGLEITSTKDDKTEKLAEDKVQTAAPTQPIAEPIVEPAAFEIPEADAIKPSGENTGSGESPKSDCCS